MIGRPGGRVRLCGLSVAVCGRVVLLKRTLGLVLGGFDRVWVALAMKREA